MLPKPIIPYLLLYKKHANIQSERAYHPGEVGGQQGLVEQDHDPPGGDPHVDLREGKLRAHQTHLGGLDVCLH